MEFSILPWFIRKDIINAIIEDYPTYSLLSREWLIETAKRHGETILNPGEPENFRNPTYAIYFGSIWFGRTDNIDWDLIYKYKSLQSILLNISPPESKVECEEFVSKLLQLPLLKSMYASFEFDQPNFDFPRLFSNQNKIEELSISLESLNRCLNSGAILFPSLIDLTIKYLKSSFETNKLLKSAPKLKKLKLDSYDEEDKLVQFGDEIIPSVRELNIQYFWGGRVIKLDLSKWPNLKRLESNCTIEFTDSNHFDNIEDLTVAGSSEYISNIASANFLNLRSLCLKITDAAGSDVMTKILKLCTSIITLQLDFFEEFELPENLPVGPYSVTDLYLKGCILINSKLLHWLSGSFNLVKLKFKYCRLKRRTPRKAFPFTTLNCLEIFTDKHEHFKKYFNRTLYPHIDHIVIGRACGSCSHVTENFKDEIIEEITGEPKTKNFCLDSYI